MLNTIINQVYDSVEVDHPFSYFYGCNFFTELFYNDLVNNIPSTDLYEPLNHPDAITDYGSTRYRLILNKESLVNIHEVWATIYDIFHSKEYRDCVFNKLSVDILKRFGSLKVNCEPTVVLYKDFSGYKISPHPDHRTKVVTTQYYLPRDNSLENTGTCFYIKDEDNFLLHKKMKFLPRHGYGFAVSKNSWHGVEPVGEIGRERDSLLVIFYQPDEKEKTKKDKNKTT